MFRSMNFLFSRNHCRRVDTHCFYYYYYYYTLNPLNAELNPICYLLALLGAHLILHVSRIRVNVFRAVQIRGVFGK